MELRYRIPHLKHSLLRMYESGKEFVRAGTVIFAMTILIWRCCIFRARQRLKLRYALNIRALSSTKPSKRRLPIGSMQLPGAELHGTHWQGLATDLRTSRLRLKITIGVLASFPAREIIVSTSASPTRSAATWMRPRMTCAAA